jgi:hypothetical protein
VFGLIELCVSPSCHDKGKEAQRKNGCPRGGDPAGSRLADEHVLAGVNLYVEAAVALGRVGGGDDGEVVERAGVLHLVGRLEVLVERVGDVAAGVEAAAGRAGAEAGAVGVLARVLHGAADGGVVGVGVLPEHAPLLGQVADALGRHDGAAVGEAERVLGRAVVVEDAPVALEVSRVDALGVLVQQREDVDVGHLRAARRALAGDDAVEEPLVELLRAGDVGVLVAVGGPADLADDDGDGAEPVLLERGDERVVVGVEDVGVEHVAVLHAGLRRRRAGRREEGVVLGEVGIGVHGQEGVDVDGEDAVVVEQEADEVDHEALDVGAEVARGGLAVTGLVDVGVERDGDADLPAQAGLHERGLDVPHRRQCRRVELALVRLEERLVAHRHGPATYYMSEQGRHASASKCWTYTTSSQLKKEEEEISTKQNRPDVDAVLGDVRGDVLEHPLLGGVDASGDAGEQLVGEADHDLDA